MMKKILFFALVISLNLLFIFSFPEKAQAANLTVGETKKEELAGGVVYEGANITTTDLDSTERVNTVNSLTVSGDNKDVKIATWSYEAQYHTTLVTLDKIAEDYEKHHPGWIVVGGVNSEGWHTENGENEISNLYVQDYKLMRTGTSSENFKELIGFYPNRDHIIKRNPSFSDTMVLHMYDDNSNETNAVKVNTVDGLPQGNDLSVLTINQMAQLDLTGYYVIQGDYTLYRPKTFYIVGCYPITNTSDGIYLEGKIKGEVSPSDYKANDYHFYLVTKSEDIKNKLANCSTIKCQYEFTDDFKNCESITGYMYKLVENNHVILPSDYEDNSDDFNNGVIPNNDSFYYDCAYYRTHGKERSSIGFKEDGSIVLLTANVKTGGPSQYELGNILQSYGCTNAYQFDGGGSVTFIKRNTNGSFDLMNETGDGHPRSIATGIFFVVRDPGFLLKDITRTTVTVNVPDYLKNVVAHIGENTYNLKTGDNVINNLEEDQDYELYLSYDTPSYENEAEYVSSRSTLKKFRTDKFTGPNPGLYLKSVSKNSIIVGKKNLTDGIYNVIVHIGDNDYNMMDAETFTCENLIEETEYELYFTYSVKDENGKEYTFDTTKTTFTTLNYNLPVIKNFSISKELVNGKVRLSYEYQDKDKIVIAAYIKDVESGEVVETLSDKVGNVTISDITKNTSYQLVLLCEATSNGETIEATVESDIINIVVEEQGNNDPSNNQNEPPADTGKKSCKKKNNAAFLILLSFTSLSSLIFIRKKQ